LVAIATAITSSEFLYLSHKWTERTQCLNILQARGFIILEV